MKNNSLVLLIVFLFSLAACKTKKEIQTGVIQDSEVYRSILQRHNIAPTGYSSKATVRFESEYESLTAKVYLRSNMHDSIWIMGKKIGIEGVRMLITRDSIYSINRQTRTYYKGPFSDIKYKYGIGLGFDDVMNAVVGNIVYDKKMEVLSSKIDSNYYNLTFNYNDLLIKHSVGLYSMLLSKSKISDIHGRTINISYDDFQALDKTVFTPYFRNYNLPNTEFGDLELEMKFSNIEIDKKPNMPFSIPSHYQKEP